MNIKTIPVGLLEMNCYLVWDDGAREAILIDPGADPGQILAVTRERNIQITGVLLTHGHVDHISALPQLFSNDDAPVFLHSGDSRLYNSPENEIPGIMPPADGLPATTDRTDDIPFPVEVLHTPGHTRGSVCFYFRDAGVLFSGDTLFCQSVGRTDLPGGSSEELKTSIQETLMSLPDDVNVYPGHGPPTTIGHERRCNPYIKH